MHTTMKRKRINETHMKKEDTQKTKRNRDTNK